MKLETFTYVDKKGWSIPKFPDLDSKNTLVLAFCAPEFINNSEPLQELFKAFPNSLITGCSSAGEIYNADILDNSLSVAVMKFDKTELDLEFSDIKKVEDSKSAGERISKKFMERPNLKSIFVLSDGLNVNGSELVNGLNKGTNNIIITGGLAGDGDRFKQTWILRDGKPVTNCIASIGFYGNKVQIGHGSKGGWDTFGPERTVTRSKGNVLYELDGKPALALYKEYLGDRAGGLPATGLLFPLMIRKNAEDPKQIVRTILSVNEADQTMTFAGDIPTGYLAKLMRANFDRLVTGANEAAITAKTNSGTTKGPVLAVAISCVGRRLLLGERTEEETESTLSSLPQGTKQVGFYSYGEISPYTTGTCDLHNQTMTLTTFSEDN